MVYCERFLEFLTDLVSQLPTRRYVNTLLQDLNLLVIIRLSPMFNNQENGLIRDLFVLLRHFMNFSIDDNTGGQYSRAQSDEKHYERLARLQRTALRHFKSKLTILALSNYGAIDRREDLESQLSEMADDELGELCTLLGYRITYPAAAKIHIDRAFLMEVLISVHERRKAFQEAVKDLSIQPTEVELYDQSLVRNETYNGARSLAIPKLNLQYLSVGDFLWRSFILYRCEQFFEVRKYLEDIIRRLQPEETGSNAVRFAGFSRTALPIVKPAILETAPPKVGFDRPAYVRAEITLNFSKLTDSVIRDWDSLRPEDVVYLIAVRPTEDSHRLTNGHSEQKSPQTTGLYTLRTAEVVQILDEQSRPLRDHAPDEVDGYSRKPRLRRLIVHLDPVAFKADTEFKEKGKSDIYDSINVIVRRSQRENNWKKVLETIQNLALSEVPMSAWLQEVFLGYGDPASATFSRLENRLRSVDFRDTFKDWNHLVGSFPGKVKQLNMFSDKADQSSRLSYLMTRASKPPAPLSYLSLQGHQITYLRDLESDEETKMSLSSKLKSMSK